MKLNEKEIRAKLEALTALLDESNMMDSDDLQEGFKGLKKVTVASDSPKGLEEGLEKAQDLVEDPKSLDEEMMEMDSDESKLSLPEAKSSSHEDSELDEDLKKTMKGKIKSKKPKMNFFNSGGY